MVICARRLEALETVAKACTIAHQESGSTHGGKFATIPLDISDKQQVATFLNKIPTELREIDILGEHG